jgi:hypothetical protein
VRRVPLFDKCVWRAVIPNPPRFCSRRATWHYCSFVSATRAADVPWYMQEGAWAVRIELAVSVPDRHTTVKAGFE